MIVRSVIPHYKTSEPITPSGFDGDWGCRFYNNGIPSGLTRGYLKNSVSSPSQRDPFGKCFNRGSSILPTRLKKYGWQAGILTKNPALQGFRLAGFLKAEHVGMTH